MPHPGSVFRLKPLILATLLFTLFTTLPANVEDGNESFLGEEDEEDAEITEAVADEIGERVLEVGEEAYWRSQQRVAEGTESAFEEARKLLRESADLEFAPAQNLLGLCYLAGMYGFDQSKRRAANWFELAAERGDKFAMVNLARCYFNGWGVWKSRKKAIAWLERALDGNDPWYGDEMTPPDWFQETMVAPSEEDLAAMPETISLRSTATPEKRSRIFASYLLGMTYQQEENLAAAHAAFYDASGFESRDPEGNYLAAVQSALDFAFAQGVERDPEAAKAMLEHSRTLFRQAISNFAVGAVRSGVFDRFALRDVEEATDKVSDESTTNTQFHIAESLADPDSDDYDPEQAVIWYELAAESGKDWATLSLAFLYSDPESPVYSPEKAFHWFRYGAENGEHHLLKGNYAICLRNGLGTTADPEAAKAYAAKHARKEFLCYLVTRDEAPTRPQTFEERVELVKEWAQKRDDPTARYFLGEMYFNLNYGVDQSYSKARKWFERAAEMEQPEALYRLGYMYDYGVHVDRDYEKANSYYRRSADGGNARAAFELGYNYLKGKGTPIDDGQARKYFLRAVELDPEYAAACNNLGHLATKELRVAREHSPEDLDKISALRDEMLQWLERGAELESGHAAWNLGNLYSAGELVEQDYRKAYRFYLRAIDYGETEAYLPLGRIYDQGHGVGRNIEEAAYYFRLCALNDEHEVDRREALVTLCNYYFLHLSTSLDLRRAMNWMLMLAHNGRPDLLGRFGDALLEIEDYRSARRLFDKLSDIKHPYLSGYGYDRLSRIYREGLGVRVSERKATRYWKEAVDREFPETLYVVAQEQLKAGDVAEGLALLDKASSFAPARYYRAALYFDGRYVETDRDRAFGEFIELAKLNYAPALYYLAITTYNHVEGAPDLDAAIDYARRAAEMKFGRADELLKRLQQRKKTESDGPSGGGSGRVDVTMGAVFERSTTALVI